MIPNMLAHVESCKAKYPEAWKLAHTESPRRLEFIKLLAIDCHEADPRFGLNGKRGNPRDLSADALNFKGAGPGHTPDGTPCSVIDCIKDAGIPSASPIWNVFTDPEAASGAWVSPMEVPGPTPVPVPPPAPVLAFPPRDRVGQFFAELDARYLDAGRDNRCAETTQPLHVDNEGIFVWLSEFIRLWVTTVLPGATIDQRYELVSELVFDEITAAGLPKGVKRRAANLASLSDEERVALAQTEKLGGVEERRNGDDALADETV